MDKTIILNMRNVSKQTFWQTLKNYKTVFRLSRAKIKRIGYNMPYGGTEKSNTYNLFNIHIKTNNNES